MSHIDFDEKPFIAIWETTQACNLACVHCRACAQPLRSNDELTTAEAKRLIDEIAGMAVPVFVLTGGDPLKRPDIFEIVQYAAGYYGKPVAPIDPNVLDKIMNSPRAKEILANPPEQPTLKELHKRYGTDNDDELILRALIPEADIKKMRAAGPLKRTFSLFSSKEVEEISRLMRVATLPVVHYQSDDISLSLRR